MQNFPFVHNGKDYWYSRSIVASTYVFAKCGKHWYTLISRRGSAVSQTGLWNVPGGFLDHNETISQAAVREVLEETGVELNGNLITLVNVNSNPYDSIKQHIIFSYLYNMGEVEALPEVSLKYSEPNEVTVAQWVRVDLISDFHMIRHHKNNIRKLYDLYIAPSLIRRIFNLLNIRVDNAL